MEFLLERLLVCFLAMRQSGIQWPPITEDELDKQAARFSATVNFADGLGPALAGQSLAQYTTGHPMIERDELIRYGWSITRFECQRWRLAHADKRPVVIAAHV